MKRIEMSKVVIAAVVVLLTAVVGLAQPKRPTVTVKGEVVDLWCYLEGGDHGAPTRNAPPPAPRPETPSAFWTRKETCT